MSTEIRIRQSVKNHESTNYNCIYFNSIFFFSPVEGLHSFVAPDCDDTDPDIFSSVYLNNMVLGYSKHYHVLDMGRGFALRVQVRRLQIKRKC